MKKWQQIVLGLALVVGLGSVLAPVPAVHAINVINDSCKSDPGSVICKKTNKSDNVMSMVKQGINIALIALGIVAVIMIIIGGFRYVISGGEAGAVKSAKNTILYAIVGLIVVALAYTIVNFVLSAFK